MTDTQITKQQLDDALREIRDRAQPDQRVVIEASTETEGRIRQLQGWRGGTYRGAVLRVVDADDWRVVVEPRKLWWHVYGHVLPAGDLAGCWQMVTAGGTNIGPGETTLTGGTPETVDVDGMPYLGSFDHQPTPAELDALTPEGYRDGD